MPLRVLFSGGCPKTGLKPTFSWMKAASVPEKWLSENHSRKRPYGETEGPARRSRRGQKVVCQNRCQNRPFRSEQQTKEVNALCRQLGTVAELSHISENSVNSNVLANVLVGGAAHDGPQSGRAEAVPELLFGHRRPCQPPGAADGSGGGFRFRPRLGAAALQPHGPAVGRSRGALQDVAPRLPVQHHQRATALRRGRIEPRLAVVSGL